MNEPMEAWIAPESLTIYEVAELESLFATGGDVLGDRTFDLAATEEIDTCGIQWLMAVQARLKASGNVLTLLNVSEDIEERLSLLGVSFVNSPAQRGGGYD